MNRKQLAGTLSVTLDQCRADVASALEADHVEQARNGAERIVQNRFAYDVYRNQAVDALNRARKTALDAIGEAIADAEKALTDPPTAEAANYILAVSQRSDMSEREVQAALDRYPGHASQKAILSAAIRSDIKYFGSTTEAERDVESLASLQKSASNTYSTLDAFMGMSAGQAAIAKAEYESYGSTGSTDARDVFGMFGTQG